MADVKPGVETSEYKLTKAIMWAGAALTVLGAVLEGLKGAGLQSGWIGTALVIIGPLLGVAKAMGYTAGRSTVKAAEVTSKGAAEVAQLLPLLKDAYLYNRKLVEDLKSGEAKSETAAPALLPPTGG